VDLLLARTSPVHLRVSTASRTTLFRALPVRFGTGAAWVLLRLLLVVAVARIAGALPPASSETAWGQPVVDVRIESDEPMDLHDFSRAITQRIGAPLDHSRVAESLKNLYATGRFRELRVDVQQKEKGVVLIFVGQAQLFVGVVQVEGAPPGMRPDTLSSASRLRLGQPLSEEDLAAARERLKALLIANGYYQAQVTSELLRHAYEVTDVLFSVAAGPQARLSAVVFEGQPVVATQRLAAVAGWKVGSHLTSAGVERGLERLRKFYVRRRRIEATVSVQSRTPDPSKNREKLVVEVQAGPVVNVSLRGAKVGAGKLRELLPLFSEGQTDDLVLDAGDARLRDYFERLGYYSASVKWSRAAAPDALTVNIIYVVRLGVRGNFVGVAFKGNQHVSTADLQNVIQLQPEEFPRVRGIFSRDLLAHDVKAIVTLYQSQGYLETKVNPAVDDHHGGEADHYFVTFNIDEGPLTTVRHLSLEGVDDTTATTLRSLLLTNPGQAYSITRARTDQDSILTYLADQGHNHADVSGQASPVPGQHQVDLTYRIEPGVREEIQRIIVMGNRYTRGGVINHQLALRVNEPLRQSDLLESQRGLYDLGVFNQVQISHEDPETGGTDRTVLVSVEEARRWTLGYGFGVDVQRLENSQPQGQYGASPRVSLDVTRLNVGGRPQTFSIRSRYSDLEKGGAATYSIPHFLNRSDLDFRLAAIDEETRDILTFTSKRQEANVILERHTSPFTFLLARYSFRRVSVVESTLRIEPQEIPLLSQPARVAMTSLTYVNDHRDNPVDATKGSYSVVDGGIAWSALGSEANFVRLSAQNSTYYRLSRHLIFARNTRVGVEGIFGGLRKVFVPPSGGKPGFFIETHDIPLPERLFMGGSESHRGFGLNQAGPRDPVTGFPVGGRAMFLNSLELRIPIVENKYGLVLFHDAGNVFSTPRKMRLLKVTQNSPTDLDYTVHAVGLGLRYNTPVGPLRLDVGYSLNPPRFQVQPQTGVVEVHRLSNVQFSLSVGQAF
jgi:outer membrane protein insertion porin family